MSAFRETLFLQCSSINIDDEEILEIIGEDELKAIKGNDPHPYFECYSIAHEGVSNPTIFDKNVEDGQSGPITFSRKAIDSIKNVLKKGIKFFHLHNKDNSTENREELGKVVGIKQKEINGKLHQLAVGYFPDKEKIKDLDICSQESIWDFIKVGGKIIADIAKDVTGIILGNSSKEKPAFPGAVKLGFVQAFENKQNEKTGDVIMTYEEIKKNSNFETVKNLVKDFNIFPWQLFSEDEIKADKEYGKLFSSITNLEKQLKEKQDAFKLLEDEKVKLQKSVDGNNAKDRIVKLMDEKKFTENMKKAIQKRYDKIKDSMDDLSDDSLSKFLDTEKEVFLEYSSIIEKKDDIKINTGDGESSSEKDPLEKEV